MGKKLPGGKSFTWERFGYSMTPAGASNPSG